MTFLEWLFVLILIGVVLSSWILTIKYEAEKKWSS